MPMPGRNVIQNVVRGFSLVHHGNLPVRQLQPPFEQGEGTDFPPPSLLTPLCHCEERSDEAIS